MKKSGIGLALALVLAPAAAHAASLCKPCPQGRKTVALHIMTEEDKKSRWFASADYHSYKVPKKMSDGGTVFISGPMQLRSALLEVADRCESIGYLRVDSHGNLGAVSFGDGWLKLSNVDDVLEGLDCVMAANADIDFGGCDVGAGCRGEDFLTAVADNLLEGGGGRVMGSTNYVTAVPLLGNIPTTLDLQILSVDAGLSNPEWRDKPQSPQKCGGRVRDALADISKIRRRMAQCTAGRSALRTLDQAEEKLKVAAEDEAAKTLLGTRFGRGRKHHEAAANFQTAFNLYFAAKDEAAGIGPCTASGVNLGPALGPYAELFSAFQPPVTSCGH